MATLYCAAFALVAVLCSHPLVLVAAAAGLLLASACAGVGREHARWLWLAVPLVVLTVVINAIVSQRGLTVVFRGGTVFGHRLDVTAEALAWGAVTGVRISVLFLACGLYALVVDPDEVLKLARSDAIRLVSEDAGLRRPEHALLRKTVLERYGQTLDLAEIG